MYFSGQGKVLVATAVNGVPGVFRHVGNAKGVAFTLGTDTFEHKESMTGQRLTDLRLITGKTAGVKFTLEDFKKENLALALYGVSSVIGAGTVTAEVLPSTIAAADFVRLAKQKVSSVVVKDSTPTTPKTLIQGTNYRVSNTDLGTLEFLELTTGAPFVQPFKADYANALVTNNNMFTTAQPEVWLRFEGLNTADSNKGVLVELYRCALSPLTELALINDELAVLDMSGSVLYDDTKVGDTLLGQFGRIVMV